MPSQSAPGAAAFKLVGKTTKTELLPDVKQSRGRLKLPDSGIKNIPPNAPIIIGRTMPQMILAFTSIPRVSRICVYVQFPALVQSLKSMSGSTVDSDTLELHSSCILVQTPVLWVLGEKF